MMVANEFNNRIPSIIANILSSYNFLSVTELDKHCTTSQLLMSMVSAARISPYSAVYISPTIFVFIF